MTILIFTILIIAGIIIYAKKHPAKKKHHVTSKENDLSEHDITYIGNYVGGEYATSFEAIYSFQDEFIKFSSTHRNSDIQFSIKLTDISSIVAVWYYDLIEIVPKEEISWKTNNIDMMKNFLLIDYIDNGEVINVVFEIAHGLDRDIICDQIQEKVDIARKKQSDIFWNKQKDHVTINRNSGDKSFVAIDFEHATPNKGTVCAVGIVTIENDIITDSYSSFIKPPDNEYFPFNSLVHGIYPTDTELSPDFATVWPEIKKRINNKTVIAHGATHTDSHCLEQAIAINGISDIININWIDTQNICNAKLDVICEVCNIELTHHDALSDTKACAEVYVRYLNNTLPIDEILKQKEQKVKNKTLKGARKQLAGDILTPDFENVENKNNYFYKKKIVVSGLYDQWPDRNDLAIKLKELGADIDTSVGKYTNILCAGQGCGPAKLKQIQALIDSGKDAEILNEQEIINLLKQCDALSN